MSPATHLQPDRGSGPFGSVDVVIPCYRYGHLLPAAVASALDDQPGVDVRVIVVDDCSPDDSADVARRLAEQDSRVEVLVHETNLGHIRTYNDGLARTTADYVALLSADDLFTPRALSRAAALLSARPEVGFVYGHPVHWNPVDPLPAARTEPTGWTVWDGMWWLRRRFREGSGCITSPEVVVRTALQHEVGGYRADLPHTGDIEMWMRLASRADVGHVDGVDQAYYRVHGQNMSQTVFKASVVDLQQRFAAYEAVLETQSLGADTESLRRHVARTLAKEALRRAYRAYDAGRTEVVDTEALRAFAVEICPTVTRTFTYGEYALRARLGPARSPVLQPVAVSAAYHRFRRQLWWRSWERRGI